MTMLLPVDRPDELDVALGYVHGLVAVDTPSRGSGTARATCEQAVLEALSADTCFVAFSGGRDSSAVLALAVHLARRHGLPEPVALTDTYPRGTPGYEGDWQERVIAHLRLKDWVRVPASRHRDALGPHTTDSLRRCGVVWPPMAHDKGASLSLARGGSLLTGEGGDEVLGNQRITPVVGAYRRRLRPRPAVLSAVSMALAPVPLRRAVLRRQHARGRPWLLPEVARHAVHDAVEVEASRPLAWDRDVRRLLRHKGAVVGFRTLDHMAAHHGVRLHHPLRDPRFVHAFADAGGRWGYLGRSEAMRVLFGDLLPPEVLARKSKASFNGAVFGPATRAWVADWDGSGVPHHLVDVHRLRAEWLSDHPHAGTLMLLQTAWLHAQKVPAAGACASYSAPESTMDSSR